MEQTQQSQNLQLQQRIKYYQYVHGVEDALSEDQQALTKQQKKQQKKKRQKKKKKILEQ